MATVDGLPGWFFIGVFRGLADVIKPLQEACHWSTGAPVSKQESTTEPIQQQQSNESFDDMLKRVLQRGADTN